MPDTQPRLAVVGPGLIGTSVALAAARRWPGLEVRTVDQGDPLEAIGDSLVVVLAMPVDAIIQTLPRLVAVVHRQALVHRHRQHEAGGDDRGGGGRPDAVRRRASHGRRHHHRAVRCAGRPVRWPRRGSSPTPTRRRPCAAPSQFVEALGARAGGADRSRRRARSPDGRGQPPAAAGGERVDGHRGPRGRRQTTCSGPATDCATPRGSPAARPASGRASWRPTARRSSRCCV